MRYPIRLLLAIISLIYLNPGCSRSPSEVADTAGGSGTTNGAVAMSDGTLAAGAKVLVIDNGNWFENYISGLSVAVESTYTDADGEFVIRDYGDTSCNIQVSHDDEALFIRNYSDSVIGSEVLRLDKEASLSVQSEMTPGSRLALFGTAYRDFSVTGDTARLKSVAPGEYMVVSIDQEGIVQASATAESGPGQAYEIEALNTDPNTLILDNFELSDSAEDVSLLGLITGAPWYTFVDDDDQVAPAWFENSIQSDPQGNRYYRIRSVLREDATYSWAGTGLGFHTDALDFSSYDGVSFIARGKGVIRMSIENDYVSELIGISPQYGVACTLFTDFQEFTIPFDSLSIDQPDSILQGYGVGDLVQEIARIEFTFREEMNTLEDTLRADIDDVMFYGAGLNEFLQVYNRE